MIGSELKALVLAVNSRKTLSALRTIDHPIESYLDAVQVLIQAESSDARPLRIVFCAGKGGFSLDQSSAALQAKMFESLCNQLRYESSIEKLIFISSLGARCSKLPSPYQSLMRTNEKVALSVFPDRSLILRMPSLYGVNSHSNSLHGLIGLMLANLRRRVPTDIYSHLETRRNYLSICSISKYLRGNFAMDDLFRRKGVLNIQASSSKSVYEISSHFWRAVRLRPILRLRNPEPLSSEYHFPYKLDGARLIIRDDVESWIKAQWIRCSLRSQS